MRVAVVGLGIQGQKRCSVAGSDVVAKVDPIHPEAQYKRIEDVPPAAFDAALVCTPDAAKIPILRYLLSNGKHVLVEKPLLGDSAAELANLQRCAGARRLACYTAYNHRFEPHIEALRQVIASGRLGKLYRARFFYGNGTARDVRNSPWRDQGSGVVADLGSHLLDMVLFLFGDAAGSCRVWRADRFENQAFDYFAFGFDGSVAIDCEMSMLSYRNTFHADVIGERGSAHIDCLCKWGPSTLTVRKRVFPSGRPGEESATLVCPDPTWAREYEHFQNLCRNPANNLTNDVWIQSKLAEIIAAIP
jgi:scyllo-inositol 2-dehydrogenase (NADP+)